MRVRALLVPLALGAALLAGCTTTGTPGTDTTTPPAPTNNGVEALAADEIFNKATGALDKASSYHLKGSAEEDGTKVDVDLLVAGDNAKGTIKSDEFDMEFVQVDGVTYMKADALFELMLTAFITDDAQRQLALLAIKGKYAKLPANDKTFDSFVPKASELLDPEGVLTKGEASTVNGTPVITLTDTEGNKIFIATVGEPYPVRLESKDGQGLDVTEVNAGATVAAPAAAEVIDIEQFTKAAG